MRYGRTSDRRYGADVMAESSDGQYTRIAIRNRGCRSDGMSSAFVSVRNDLLPPWIGGVGSAVGYANLWPPRVP